MSSNKAGSSTELSDDDKFTLIDCVKHRPILWDVADKDYKAKHLKGAEWQKVVQDMNESTGRKFGVEACKDQWERLRRQYNNNKNMVTKKTGSGAQAEPVWRFWSQMLFVDSRDVQTTRITSVTVKQEQEECVVVDEDEGEEDVKENKPIIGPTRPIQKIAAKTPTTSKKRRVEPELELIHSMLAKPEKEFDPLAQMVDQMVGRIRRTGDKRAQLSFKEEILGVVNQFERWLITAEEGVEEGDEGKEVDDVAAFETH